MKKFIAVSCLASVSHPSLVMPRRLHHFARGRVNQPDVQACPCAKRPPIGSERHLRSLLVAATGMRAVADCLGARRIANVSDGR
jgi:hypothetical protein